MPTATQTVDHSWNLAYKVGGISFLIIGIWWLLSLFWGAIAGVGALGFATPPVVTSQQYFNVLAAHPAASNVFYGMYSLADLLLIPALIALYLALRHINKNAVLIAMGLVAACAIVELGVTEFNSLTLISLTQSYNVAADATQRAAYLAAANYALAAIPIATFYSYLLGSVGFFIASVVMLKGVFRRRVAFIGMAANGLGFVSAFVLFAPGLAVVVLLALFLFGVWSVLVGVRLYRLSNQS